MVKKRETTKEERHKEWAEMVQECESSGKSVKEWCQEKRINIRTYYGRLRKLHEGIKKKESERQSIIPVSVSEEMRSTEQIMNRENREQRTTKEKKTEKVIIRKNGVEIELPEDVSEKTIYVLLRGLSQC